MRLHLEEETLVYVYGQLTVVDRAESRTGKRLKKTKTGAAQGSI